MASAFGRERSREIGEGGGEIGKLELEEEGLGYFLI